MFYFPHKKFPSLIGEYSLRITVIVSYLLFSGFIHGTYNIPFGFLYNIQSFQYVNSNFYLDIYRVLLYIEMILDIFSTICELQMMNVSRLHPGARNYSENDGNATLKCESNYLGAENAK